MTSIDGWKLSRVLGTGGFGIVELWTHVQSGKKIGNTLILNIFCVLFYKIITYEIEDTTTLGDLQLLIERDTNIEIKNQLLTDYKGAVLIENNVSLKSQTNDHVFFLFRNGCCSIEDISISNIPAAVKEMMTQSRNELNSEILKDYYRHTIYFVKKEMYLFQLYIFALNINVDLFQQKIDMFNTNVEKTLENIKILIDQVHIIRMKYVNTTDENATNKKKVEIFDKVDKLINAANKIKVKFISLKEDNNRLIDKARDIDYIGNLSELYDKMCNVYLKFKQESPYKPAMPLDMVKLMFTFLTAREKQLYSQNIIDITSQLQELQDKLSKLEMIFISVTAMTEFYWKEYQKIAQSDTIDNNISQQSNIHQSLNISTIDLGSIIQSEDNVIYDNLIIRYK
ncbi:uncharacterized protein LOC105422150 [Pogonomyrmex barbatus]|uniref:Uncharacterized protein LOC105422150 n=1 Tax=Pogonomyrmex barbatus TaxID=144034 RepID=A0A8N1S465_9HYME|nr:uncharacterized protein LOC105422150 [Pogonomyrmex barbatus]